MSQAATMRAVAISEPGGPEVLTIEDRPIPVVGRGEALVAVAAAGVNRPRRHAAQGPVSAAARRLRYSRPGDFRAVARVGEGVTRFARATR